MRRGDDLVVTMADDQRWALTLRFTGVADGGLLGSLGNTPYECRIEATGPNGQVRERLLVSAGAFHVMLRDADPAILLELAKIPPPGHAIQIKE